MYRNDVGRGNWGRGRVGGVHLGWDCTPIAASVRTGRDFAAEQTGLRLNPDLLGNLVKACKVGWEATRRFWEDDANEIYGGISFTDNIITQMWDPSEGYFSQRGTWQDVPFQLGGWANWTSSSEDSAAYSRLLEPDPRFHVVGDQVSQLPGWQEGAMASAEHVVEQIAGVRPLTSKEITLAPDTRRLVEGLY